MMPMDDDNKRLMLALLSPRIIPAGSRLLAAGMTVMEHAPKKPTRRLSYFVLRTIAGLVAQATLQYRAVFQVAELAIDDAAAMLTRGLFESLLAERFILKRPVRLDGLSPATRGQVKKLPRMPSGRGAAEFRAELYTVFRFHRHARNWKGADGMPGLKETVTAERTAVAEQRLKDIEKRMGKWSEVLKRSYSGLTVADLSERYGLRELHQAIYSELSMASHSNRAAHYASTGESDGDVNVRMHGDVLATLLAIHLASVLYVRLLADIAVELGIQRNDLLERLLAEIIQECERLEHRLRTGEQQVE